MIDIRNIKPGDTVTLTYEVAEVSYAATGSVADIYPHGVMPDTEPKPRRCPLCGWFIGRSDRCANEVPVQGGWLWEHR